MFVGMYVIASAYDPSSFSTTLLANCFIVHVEDRPAPHAEKNERNKFILLNVAHILGTSTTHDIRTLLRSFSFMTFAYGLQIFTSKE